MFVCNKPFKSSCKIICLIIPVVSILSLNLCIAKFWDERKWCCSYTNLTENIPSAWDQKMQVKFQKYLNKVPIRMYCNILRRDVATFTSRNKIRKCLLFTNFVTYNYNWYLYLPLCNDNILHISYIWNLRKRNYLIRYRSLNA